MSRYQPCEKVLEMHPAYKLCGAPVATTKAFVRCAKHWKGPIWPDGEPLPPLSKFGELVAGVGPIHNCAPADPVPLSGDLPGVAVPRAVPPGSLAPAADQVDPESVLAGFTPDNQKELF